jgi:hypothetical protein
MGVAQAVRPVLQELGSALAELLPALAVLALVGGEHLAALSYLGVEVIALSSDGCPHNLVGFQREGQRQN